VQNTIRIFISNITAGLVALVMTSASFANSDSPRSIIGYSDEHTVRPGESINFMVNAVDGGTYQADLVRIVNGDYLTVYKEHFKVVDVEPFMPVIFSGIFSLSVSSGGERVSEEQGEEGGRDASW
jgi:hypothetical protein